MDSDGEKKIEVLFTGPGRGDSVLKKHRPSHLYCDLKCQPDGCHFQFPCYAPGAMLCIRLFITYDSSFSVHPTSKLHMAKASFFFPLSLSLSLLSSFDVNKTFTKFYVLCECRKFLVPRASLFPVSTLYSSDFIR